MNRILVLTLICAAMCLCAGCEPLSFGRKKKEPEPTETPDQKQIRDLRAQVTTLEAQVAVRDSRIDELRKRADRLSQQVKKLEFINERQEKQIEVLAQAPLARDEYKALTEQLKQSLERVTARLAKLEAANTLLMHQLKMAAKIPTTKPAATRPTTEPAITPVTTGPAIGGEY